MKSLEPSIAKGLMFLRHEMEDVKNNMLRNETSEGPLLRREHHLNTEKLEYWIEHIRKLEKHDRR